MTSSSLRLARFYFSRTWDGKYTIVTLLMDVVDRLQRTGAKPLRFGVPNQNARHNSLVRHTIHPFDDLNIFYNPDSLAKVASIVRQAKPSIVLTHAAIDYMEDHMETCRLAVSATFAKGVRNFACTPERPSFEGDVAIYHAQPHGNRTPLNEIVRPGITIPIDTVMQRKIAMLECHQSQQLWLQTTQGMNSYLQTMLELGEEVTQLSAIKKTESRYAEGWHKHLHLGFGSRDFDPLAQFLKNE